MESEGQEMEVYVPMLTQIPPDFKSPPLDTKVRKEFVEVSGKALRIGFKKINLQFLQFSLFASGLHS